MNNIISEDTSTNEYGKKFYYIQCSLSELTANPKISLDNLRTGGMPPNPPRKTVTSLFKPIQQNTNENTNVHHTMKMD